MGVATGWTSPAVTWGGGIPGPSRGNGTLAARVKRLNGSYLFAVRLVIGSTTTLGNGPWSFDFEDAPVAKYEGVNEWACAAIARDVSAGSSGYYYSGAVLLTPGSNSGGAPPIVQAVFGQGVGFAGPTTPFEWAAGDRLLIGNAIEAFDN